MELLGKIGIFKKILLKFPVLEKSGKMYKMQHSQHTCCKRNHLLYCYHFTWRGEWHEIFLDWRGREKRLQIVLHACVLVLRCQGFSGNGDWDQKEMCKGKRLGQLTFRPWKLPKINGLKKVVCFWLITKAPRKKWWVIAYTYCRD